MKESTQLAALNARLAECHTRRRERDKLTAMIQETQRQLAVARRTLEDSNKVLAKETSDVKSLEGLSLTALFYTVLGTHEERLEKERQEQLAAKLKYDQAMQAVIDLDTELTDLSRQKTELGDVDTTLETALQEKSVYLRQTGDPATARLAQLAEALSDLTAQERELRQAVRAGNRAIDAIQDVQSALSSASNWGTVDMLGGGMLTTMAKHSRIDAARRDAHRAQGELMRFQQELADANERLQVSLEIGGFSKFADYFFDGLIADWIVQSKIANAASQCAEVRYQVTNAVRTCENRLREVDDLRKECVRDRARIIESA